MASVAIICTEKVPLETLENILNSTYTKSIPFDSGQGLVLLSDDTSPALRQYGEFPFSSPPIDPAFQSPFLGRDVEDVARILGDIAPATGVNGIHPHPFLIADSRTREDQTLSLVEVDTLDDNKIVSVRISGEMANAEAVAVRVGSKDVRELGTLVDEDGVYRGGPSRGKPVVHPTPTRAPRKQL